MELRFQRRQEHVDGRFAVIDERFNVMDERIKASVFGLRASFEHELRAQMTR